MISWVLDRLMASRNRTELSPTPVGVSGVGGFLKKKRKSSRLSNFISNPPRPIDVLLGVFLQIKHVLLHSSCGPPLLMLSLFRHEDRHRGAEGPSLGGPRALCRERQNGPQIGKEGSLL